MAHITADDDGCVVVEVDEDERISVFTCARTVEFSFTENSVRFRLHSLVHPWFEEWVDLNLDDFRRDRPTAG